jgi:pyruvate/2-oxoglutarate dehydrogenase complex dihydrolipoamide dehydrogenase (E3) component
MNKSKTAVIKFAKIIGKVSKNSCIPTKVLRHTTEQDTSS